MSNESQILLYRAEDGKAQIQVKLQDETVWLTQAQMAELFQKDVRTINEHIKNIYAEGELEKGATIRNFRIVQADSQRKGNSSTRRQSVASRNGNESARGIGEVQP